MHVTDMEGLQRDHAHVAKLRLYPQGLLDEVFVRGAKRVLRVQLQLVDPWESRPEALSAPCYLNLRQSNKTNSSGKIIFTVKWSHCLVESRSDNFKLFEKVYLPPSTCHSAIFTEKVQIICFFFVPADAQTHT
jgi:hypothetical protein